MEYTILLTIAIPLSFIIMFKAQKTCENVGGKCFVNARTFYLKLRILQQKGQKNQKKKETKHKDFWKRRPKIIVNYNYINYVINKTAYSETKKYPDDRGF